MTRTTKKMLILLELAIAGAVATRAHATVSTCVGDCDGNGAVSAAELVAGVHIALGILPLEHCPQFACHGTDEVRVDCLVGAVSAALNECRSPLATPTPQTNSATPTVTP